MHIKINNKQISRTTRSNVFMTQNLNTPNISIGLSMDYVLRYHYRLLLRHRLSKRKNTFGIDSQSCVYNNIIYKHNTLVFFKHIV